jgi:hypothetical protein
MDWLWEAMRRFDTNEQTTHVAQAAERAEAAHHVAMNAMRGVPEIKIELKEFSDRHGGLADCCQGDPLDADDDPSTRFQMCVNPGGPASSSGLNRSRPIESLVPVKVEPGIGRAANVWKRLMDSKEIIDVCTPSPDRKRSKHPLDDSQGDLEEENENEDLKKELVEAYREIRKLTKWARGYYVQESLEPSSIDDTLAPQDV